MPWDPSSIFNGSIFNNSILCGNPMSDQSMLASPNAVPSDAQIAQNRKMAEALSKGGTEGPQFKPVLNMPFSKWQGASNMVNDVFSGLALRQASIAEQRKNLELALGKGALQTPPGGRAPNLGPDGMPLPFGKSGTSSDATSVQPGFGPYPPVNYAAAPDDK
jgi:hypothetical protein